MAIWKWILEPTDVQHISMPIAAEALSVQMQGTQMCLWAYVHPTEDLVVRRIRVVGTGHQFAREERDALQYVGTVQMLGGNLVWHVFISKE